MRLLMSATSAALLTFAVVCPDSANAHSGMKNCGMCHQMPDNVRLDKGFDHSLDVEKIQAATSEQLKSSLLDFAKRRETVMKLFNREAVCRGFARYISVTLSATDPCPAEVRSSDGQIVATVDSVNEQQKEFLGTILGQSKNLIQKNQNVVDSLKIIVTLNFNLDLAPNITVEIYQPTFFQTASIKNQLVDDRIIPKSYSPELTAAQKAIGGHIERAMDELRSKEGRRP